MNNNIFIYDIALLNKQIAWPICYLYILLSLIHLYIHHIYELKYIINNTFIYDIFESLFFENQQGEKKSIPFSVSYIRKYRFPHRTYLLVDLQKNNLLKMTTPRISIFFILIL